MMMSHAGMDHEHMSHGHMNHGGTDHQNGGGHEGHAMAMKDLPMGQAIAWIAGTYVILIAAVRLTNFVVPVRF